MATRRRRFTPYRPPTPPAGSYDPSLDAQEAAARRGLVDLRGDLGTQQARDVTDYAMGQDELSRARYRNQSDIQSQMIGNFQDIDTQLNRTAEDEQRQTQLLNRQFGILGRNQLQAVNTAGVIRGGALLQAAARRAENQGIEQQSINQAAARRHEDLSRQRQRVEQEGARAIDRGFEDYNLGMGKLGLEYSLPDANNPLGGRRYQDRTTQVTRAERENTAFGLDIGAQRSYQAAGAGWDPEPKPSNEFGTGANAYRVLRQGNTSVAYRPNGTVLWRRPVRRR